MKQSLFVGLFFLSTLFSSSTFTECSNTHVTDTAQDANNINILTQQPIPVDAQVVVDARPLSEGYLVGLPNLDTTCFINSFVQLLYRLNDFKDAMFVLEGTFDSMVDVVVDDSTVKKRGLVQKLQQLFRIMSLVEADLQKDVKVELEEGETFKEETREAAIVSLTQAMSEFADAVKNATQLADFNQSAEEQKAKFDQISSTFQEMKSSYSTITSIDQMLDDVIATGQHDVHEFAYELLDIVEECLGVYGVLGGFQVKYDVTLKLDGYKERIAEQNCSFPALPLYHNHAVKVGDIIPVKQLVDDLLINNTVECRMTPLMSEDEIAVKDVHQIYELDEIPSSVLLFINRTSYRAAAVAEFGGARRGRKTMQNISFDPINFTQYTSDFNQEHVYFPVGFVVHSGMSTNSGHYVYYQLRDDGLWLFNDKVVSLMELNVAVFERICKNSVFVVYSLPSEDQLARYNELCSNSAPVKENYFERKSFSLNAKSPVECKEGSDQGCDFYDMWMFNESFSGTRFNDFPEQDDFILHRRSLNELKERRKISEEQPTVAALQQFSAASPVRQIPSHHPFMPSSSTAAQSFSETSNDNASIMHNFWNPSNAGEIDDTFYPTNIPSSNFGESMDFCFTFDPSDSVEISKPNAKRKREEEEKDQKFIPYQQDSKRQRPFSFSSREVAYPSTSSLSDFMRFFSSTLSAISETDNSADFAVTAFKKLSTVTDFDCEIDEAEMEPFLKMVTEHKDSLTELFYGMITWSDSGLPKLEALSVDANEALSLPFVMRFEALHSMKAKLDSAQIQITFYSKIAMSLSISSLSADFDRLMQSLALASTVRRMDKRIKVLFASFDSDINTKDEKIISKHIDSINAFFRAFNDHKVSNPIFEPLYDPEIIQSLQSNLNIASAFLQKTEVSEDLTMAVVDALKTEPCTRVIAVKQGIYILRNFLKSHPGHALGAVLDEFERSFSTRPMICLDGENVYVPVFEASIFETYLSGDGENDRNKAPFLRNKAVFQDFVVKHLVTAGKNSMTYQYLDLLTENLQWALDLACALDNQELKKDVTDLLDIVSMIPFQLDFQ